MSHQRSDDTIPLQQETEAIIDKRLARVIEVINLLIPANPGGGFGPDSLGTVVVDAWRSAIIIPYLEIAPGYPADSESTVGLRVYANETFVTAITVGGLTGRAISGTSAGFDPVGVLPADENTPDPVTLDVQLWPPAPTADITVVRARVAFLVI